MYISRVIRDNPLTKKKMKNENPTFEEIKEMLICDFTDELESCKEYGENGYGEDEDYFEQLISALEDCETSEEIIETMEDFGRGDYSSYFE
jgi:hypothetical protein